MCGIIGVYVNSGYRYQRLSKNLNNIFTNQKNRGEDGAGFSRLRGKKDFKIKRYLSPDAMFREIRKNQDFRQGDVWLLHHRIPTCTSNKEEYNHPLASKDGFISVIHNGVLWDKDKLYDEYKDKLNTIEDKDTKKFTDSELIRVILEEELRGVKKRPWHTNSIKKALKVMANKIRGRFAFAFTIKGDDKVWLFKNGNPIVLYKDNQDNYYFSSQYPEDYGAFTKLDNEELIDGEFGYIDSQGYRTKGFLDKKDVDKMTSFTTTYYGGGSRTFSSYDSDYDSTMYNDWNKQVGKRIKGKNYNLEDEDYGFEDIDNLEEPDKYFGEEYLPMQYAEVENVNEGVENYLDALNARNIRKYDDDLAEIRNNLDKQNKGRFVFEEVTCSGEHPIVKRQQFQIIVALSEALERGSMDKESFIRISAVVMKNMDLAFKRILMENYALLSMANICKTKADTMKNVIEYYTMEWFDEATLKDINFEMNKQYNEDIIGVEKILDRIKLKYFQEPSKKKRKNLAQEIKLLFNLKPKKVNVLEDEKLIKEEEKRQGFEDMVNSNETAEAEKDNEREFKAEQQYNHELKRLGYVKGA